MTDPLKRADPAPGSPARGRTASGEGAPRHRLPIPHAARGLRPGAQPPGAAE